MSPKAGWGIPVVAGTCLLVLTGPLAGQGAPARAATWRTRDAAIAFVEARDGIDASSVYAIHQAGNGTLRIGHDRGVLRYTGHRWTPDEGLTAYRGQVRTMLESEGWLWVGGRDGVMRQRGDSVEQYEETTGGLPDRVVYAIDTTRVFGRPTVVAATGRGLARWSGRGFVPVPLPSGVLPIGLTVASTTGADGRTPTLWVASATRGIAHLTGGRWRVDGPDDGLGMTRAEHLVPGAPGSGVELYVVGSEGVVARIGGAWRRVALSMSSPYRAAVVPRRDGTRELWVGSLDGLLMRQLVDGRWDTVPVVRGRNPSAVQAITPLIAPSGDAAVYVGLRGDRMVRVTLGPARDIEFVGAPGPRALRGVALDTAQGSVRALWVATIGRGVMRVTPTGTRMYSIAEGLPDRNVFGVLHRRADGREEVWAVSGEGPARFRNGRWTTLREGLGMRPLTVVAEVHDPDGQARIAVGGYDGVFIRRDERWVRDTLLPPGPVSALAEVDGADGRAMWAAVPLGLFRQSASGWIPERPFGERAVTLASIRTGQLLHGDSAVFVSGAPGFAWRRPNERGWRVVSMQTHVGVPEGWIWDVATARHRVYASTPSGVLQFRWMGPDSLALETAYGEADGLPSSDGARLAVGPDDQIYVATARGLGLLPLPDPAGPTGAAPLLAWMRRGVGGEPVAPDDALPHDVGLLEAELGMQAFHRESDARYRVQLDGSDQPPTPWTSRTTYTFAALRPGHYVLRAWARDWRGRESALAPFGFSVRPPWWASWPAVLGYVLVLASGVALGMRARVRSLKERADELERSERRVAASERKFRALFDRAQDANLLVEHGVIVGFNDAARTLVGASGDADARALLAPLADAAALGALDDGARLVRRADGVLVPAREARTAIALEDRLLEHVVLRDVSAVRTARAQAVRLEEQLREAQKLESLGTLAGGVAHDFNNLLSIIRGNVELARELAVAGVPTRHELEEVLRTTDRARDLVQQILTFSRRSPSRREPVDLAPLMHGLRSLLRATIPSTVELRITGPTSGCWVEGDSTQLQQALLNLCTNAEHAMRTTNGGRLTLAVEPATAEHPRVTVRVSDTGVGMSPEVRARVFEPFFTTKPVGEGTGLGLSVLHGIVAAHGGEVAVESTEGVGTQVTLAFPSVDVPATPVPSEPDPGRGLDAPRGAGEHVFVVDDEPAIRTVAVRALTALGYVARPFDDPAAVLDALRDPTVRADVLVTDQTMPGMTGDVLVLAARQLRPTLPALIVTGFSHRLTSERVAELGVPVLQKPLRLSALGHAVAEALAVSSRERSPG